MNVPGFTRVFDCDTARIVRCGEKMWLFLGWKRNTKDQVGTYWLRTVDGETERVDFEYLEEKVVASGRTKHELIASAKEYKRLLGMDVEEWLKEQVFSMKIICPGCGRELELTGEQKRDAQHQVNARGLLGIETDAYFEGVQAHRDGLSEEANPYRLYSYAQQHWHYGWAQERLLKKEEAAAYESSEAWLDLEVGA